MSCWVYLSFTCNANSLNSFFENYTNEELVVSNRVLREDIDEINSHYQEFIVVSKEALKRKRQTQSLCVELKQNVQEITQQNQELLKRVKDL